MTGVERSALDWTKGISLSILASIIGGVSKLAIRKSWLLQAEMSKSGTGGCGQKFSLSDDKVISGAAASMDETKNETSDILCLREDQEKQLFDENSKFVPYCLRYSGMFGMSVLNPVCNVIALNFETPSIHAPLAGLTLVWVILGSPLVNNEQPSSRQILACSLIFFGEVMIAVFGDHTNDVYVSVEDVKSSYERPAFLLYFVGLLVYLVLMAYLINCSASPTLLRFAWGCSGGAITGAQNFLKDSLIILKVKGPQESLPPLFFLFSFLAGSTAFVGLLLLTACMKRYDATYSVASFVGSLVVSASVMAAVHYNTFAQLSGALNSVLYPSGILVLILGVNLLVWSNTEYTKDSPSTEQQRKLIESHRSQPQIINSSTPIIQRHKDIEATGIEVTQRYTW